MLIGKVVIARQADQVFRHFDHFEKLAIAIDLHRLSMTKPEACPLPDSRHVDIELGNCSGVLTRATAAKMAEHRK